MRDLVLGLFWVIAVPLTFVNPAAGIVFWVWDALLSPTELAYSFMQSVETNKLIAIVTMLSFAITQRRRQVYFDRTAIILLAVVFVATCSYATSLTSTSLGDELYLKLLKEVVLAFAIMYLISTKEWLYLLLVAISVSLGFFGVKEGLIAVLTAGGHTITGARATGDNNQLASALISTIPFMYALFRCTASRALRTGFLIAIYLTIVTVIMTFSRGGFLGLIVLGLLFLKGSKHRVVSLVVLAMAAIAVVNFAPATWFDRVDTIQDASSDGSFMGRVIAWKLSWLIALDNPIFGGGFHALQLPPVWQHYVPMFSQLDFIPTSLPDVIPHAAHSIYFEVIGDLGFSGLLVYSGMVWIGFANCRAAKKIALRHQSMPWMVDFSDAVRTSLICFLVTGAALSLAYYELLFVIIAVSSCCRQIAMRSATEQDVEPVGDTVGEPTGRARACGAIATNPPIGCHAGTLTGL